eukprot:scaffold117771_cov23-Prasinocladus_malaysianus.AAC.2
MKRHLNILSDNATINGVHCIKSIAYKTAIVYTRPYTYKSYESCNTFCLNNVLLNREVQTHSHMQQQKK